MEELKILELSLEETPADNKPKITIAKPDVVLVQEFMTPDMIAMVRPTNTLIDMERMPYGIPSQPVDRKMPTYMNKILDAYNNGMRYKEFRNLIKKADRKQQKDKDNKISIEHDKTISFD